MSIQNRWRRDGWAKIRDRQDEPVDSARTEPRPMNWDGVPPALARPHSVEARTKHSTKRYRSTHAHPLAYSIYLPPKGSIVSSLLGAREIKLR